MGCANIGYTSVNFVYTQIRKVLNKTEQNEFVMRFNPCTLIGSA